MFVFIMMSLGTLAFMIFPRELLSLFAENEEVANSLASIGVPCLRIISTSFLVAAFCIVILSMLQALGNSVYSMIVSIIRQIVVLLPVAYLLSLTKNLDLVWFSFLIAELVALIFAISLFKKVYRDKIKPLGA